MKRTPFLQYKYLAEHASTRRAWYEPTHAAKLKAFFNKVDWSRMDSNVERILFSRGQEEDWDADELYAQLGELPPERVAEVLDALRQNGWQFLDTDARERFLLEWLPEFEELFDLLADFRFGGYRVLWGILLDIDQENATQDRKRLNRDGDSPAFTAMMEAYQKRRLPSPTGMPSLPSTGSGAVRGSPGQARTAVGASAGRRSAQRAGGAPC